MSFTNTNFSDRVKYCNNCTENQNTSPVNINFSHSSRKHNNKYRCHFCGGNHNCRNCPIEKKVAPQLKKIIGKKIEHFVSDNISCPICGCKTLRLLGDNSPSLDIVCDNPECLKKFEVKSKCLSCKELPDDIKINHGNFKYYTERQKDGLDFIIVIYKVDRKNKISEIRKIIHVPDSDIKNNNNFIVTPNKDNNYCQILINNHNLYNCFRIKQSYQLSFKDDIKRILSN